MSSSVRTVPATLGVRGLIPVVAGLRALGHEPEPLLHGVGIEPALLADPDARVPAAHVMRLLAEGAAATGDADLGLHLALAAPLAAFDVHAYVFLSSPTLGAGYERLCRLQRLINDRAQLTLTRTGKRATLRHALAGGLAIPRHSAEFVVAGWLRIGRVATGRDWSPLAVRFAHPPPADTAALEAHFRCPIRFAAGENALDFDAALLDAPSTAADPGLLAVLERHAGMLLEQVPAAPSLAERVRAALPDALRRGDARAATIAARLHMSVRTLQRGLADEGTAFADILDGVRHQLAVRELTAGRLAISEIAFLLGFAELSSFYRAFRRWTGRTPADYRSAAGTRGARGQFS